MIITSLTIAPPETGVDCMRGQRRQRKQRPDMFVESVLGVAVATALWAVRTWLDNSQDQTGHRPVATAFEAPTVENFSAGKLRRAKEASSSTMLRMMQVTMGK